MTLQEEFESLTKLIRQTEADIGSYSVSLYRIKIREHKKDFRVWINNAVKRIVAWEERKAVIMEEICG
jgi:hypothetical protein